MDVVERSKLVAKILRHQPELAGLELAEGGWVLVTDLLAGLARLGAATTEAELRRIVETNKKKRFTLSEDGRRIRASQGHTVEIDLGYAPQEPPTELFHGTIAANLPSIRAKGLASMARIHVHLSVDRETAQRVGMRYGKPVILVIRAAEMAAAGHTFFLADNGVWLTERVPPEFLVFPR